MGIAVRKIRPIKSFKNMFGLSPRRELKNAYTYIADTTFKNNDRLNSRRGRFDRTTRVWL